LRLGVTGGGVLGSAEKSLKPSNETEQTMHTIGQLPDLAPGDSDLAAMHEVATWIRRFVAQPCAEMGRKGPVCPFVPYALKLDTIRLMIVRPAPIDLQQALTGYAETFRNLPSEPTTKMFNFLLLLIPEIEEGVLRRTAKRMMPFFAANHMMVGPFGPNYQVASVRNPAYQDVWRAPKPIIGFRWMVQDDTVFAGRCQQFDRSFRPAYDQMFGDRSESTD